MRITESRMRQIIREEAKSALQEMPYAGNFEPASGERKASNFEDDAEAFDYRFNPSGAERYARSKKFRALAEKHFSHIPFPVWIAPLIGGAARTEVPGYGATALGYGGGRSRQMVTPLVGEGLAALRDQGFSGVDSVDPRSDLVIMASTTTGARVLLGSPWMIFHSIFHDEIGRQELAPTLNSLCDIAREAGGGSIPAEHAELLRSVISVENSHGRFFPALTMASARSGVVADFGEQDALAELMCQELLTGRGVRFNESRIKPEDREAFELLETYIKLAADEFRRAAPGNLITVSVN